MKLILPSPPSLNKLYRRSGHGKTYKTKLHSAYFNDLVKLITINRILPIKGRVGIDLVWFRPYALGDLDNIFKTAFDAIKVHQLWFKGKKVYTGKFGVYMDDSQIYRMSAVKEYDDLNPRLEIDFYEIPETNLPQNR